MAYFSDEDRAKLEMLHLKQDYIDPIDPLFMKKDSFINDDLDDDEIIVLPDSRFP